MNTCITFEDLLSDDVNASPRCPVVVLIDSSASMGQILEGDTIPTGEIYVEDGQVWNIVSGGTCRMHKMIEGLNLLHDEIKNDEIARASVEIKLISFNDSPENLTDFELIDDFSTIPPWIDCGGETAIGDALYHAMEEVDIRKNYYKTEGIPYYQPWIILMTDGKPTIDDWQAPAGRLKELAEKRHIVFIGAGIGDQYDAETLSQIVPSPEFQIDIKDNEFRKFFKWLSASIAAAGNSTAGEDIKLLPYDENWVY
jgi:uncharacterized protein YegL